MIYGCLHSTFCYHARYYCANNPYDTCMFNPCSFNPVTSNSHLLHIVILQCGKLFRVLVHQTLIMVIRIAETFELSVFDLQVKIFVYIYYYASQKKKAIHL